MGSIQSGSCTNTRKSYCMNGIGIPPASHNRPGPGRRGEGGRQRYPCSRLGWREWMGETAGVPLSWPGVGREKEGQGREDTLVLAG